MGSLTCHLEVAVRRTWESKMARKERVYRDPSAAHEHAMKLKRKGKTNIRIDFESRGTVVSWNEVLDGDQ